MKNRQAGFAHIAVLLVVVVGVAIFGIFTLVRSQAARNPNRTQDRTRIGSAIQHVAIDFTEVETRSSGTTLQRQNTAITDQQQWNQTWADLHADATPVPRLPAIDFRKERVIVVSRGEQSSGGYGIEIERVSHVTETKGQRARSMVEVSVAELNPGDGCFGSSGLQSPYQIVKIPKEPQDKVVFKFNTKTVAC